MADEPNAGSATTQGNTDAGDAGAKGTQGTGDAGDKGQTTSWRDVLAEDLRGHDGLKAYEKPDDLVKAYLELTDGKTKWETEKAELEAKIPKAPDKPDGYEIDVPEGLPVDEGFMKGFREMAHSLGLSQDQVKKQAEWYMGLAKTFSDAQAAQEKQAKDAEEAAVAALKKEWGASFGEKKTLAQKSMEKIMDKQELAFVKETGFFEDPVFIRIWDKISDAISDDAFVEGKRTVPSQMKRSASGTPMLSYGNSPSMPR